MNTREVAAEYRLASWAQAMQERAETGDSIKEYCIRKGIKRSAFFYWQRRLREIACQQMAMTETASQPNLSAPVFTEVRMIEAPAQQPEPAAVKSDQIRAEVLGVHITADSGYPADKLAVLLRRLSRP